MKIIDVETLISLVGKHSLDLFLRDLILALKRDYGRWNQFTNIPRPSMHVEGGVLELMPICDNELYYTYKYVNGHPKNPETGKMTVVATGQLSEISTGYPLMFSEMTLLTALRTAANSALATDLMSRNDAKVLAIIGTGAQSEFQVRGVQLVRDIQEVRYFDIDGKAMDKFEKNMKKTNTKLVRCKSAKEAVKDADIITICTACKEHVDVIKNAWIKKGVHINALGGDTIGKTELEFDILKRSRIVVEYFNQAYIEGEIQRFSRNEAKNRVFAEIHELVTGSKIARENDEQITVFDSVGIALEDYSALRLVYELSEKYNIGEELDMIPVLKDSKDLISVLT
ncbi:MAG TPA: ornithine cyclodeaminase [Candidatus Saccharimonadales bacterium]|nr:ornithine cyclodeaminase [Candidatus Saccharimonadales bacterium]